MANKNTFQIIITIILAVIASALTIIVLEKAGVISFSKGHHAHLEVRNNTAHFHEGEVEAGHKHDANCGHAEHKHAEHKHDADCGHAEHKHTEHKHGSDCGHSKH